MAKAYYYFKQALFYFFLTAYALLMAKALLFKQLSPFELFSADRTILRSLNLTPMKETFQFFLAPHSNLWISLLNVAGNIVLFIPFGLYLQIFKKNKKVSGSLFMVFAASLCVETAQYIFGIGYTDIDDIILNTLGGLIGIVIYKAVLFVMKDESKAKTAITYLFLLASACAGLFYLYITAVRGYRVRII